MTTIVGDPARGDDADANAIEQWAVRLTRRPGWPEQSIEAERHCVALAAQGRLDRAGVRVPAGSTQAQALGEYLATASDDSRDLILGWIHIERLRRQHLHAPEGRSENHRDDNTDA